MSDAVQRRVGFVDFFNGAVVFLIGTAVFFFFFLVLIECPRAITGRLWNWAVLEMESFWPHFICSVLETHSQDAGSCYCPSVVHSE
jgi:hypothetical protein